VRNPVLAARAVMERTPHVLLAGPAAEALAEDAGVEQVAGNGWFTTEARRLQWERHVAQDKAFGRRASPRRRRAGRVRAGAAARASRVCPACLPLELVWRSSPGTLGTPTRSGSM
jgi:isoaspartyl peptidase/L-asparaginase-like protein (Ntn-hydrolase superfamily)